MRDVCGTGVLMAIIPFCDNKLSGRQAGRQAREKRRADASLLRTLSCEWDGLHDNYAGKKKTTFVAYTLV